MSTATWYSFNWLDITILVILLLSIVISFFRGFLREAVSLLTWILAILLALKFAPYISMLLQSHIESGALRYIIGFATIFIVVLFLGVVVNFLIKMIIDKTGLSITDRVLGVIFGAARGILAVAVILMFISASPAKNENWVAQSHLAPYFQPVVSWLNKFLPTQMKQVSDWVNL